MDSTGRIVSAMQQTARNLHLPIPSDAAVKGIIGLGLTECINILFPALNADLNTDHSAITKEYRYQYVEGDKTPSPLFSGVKTVLQQLKAKGYQLAVATGKARHGLDRVLDESDLRGYFVHTVAADEVANAKPSPDMLQLLMAKTNTKPSQVVMIGDTGFDLEMAKRANVASIGVTFGAQSKQQLQTHQPLAIIKQFTELAELFS